MAQIYDILTIDGQIPPMPQSLKVVHYTLDKESYTSANGTLIRNPVAKKMKFFLTFPPMYKSDLEDLLDMLKKDKFTVTYMDFFDGSTKSGSFYRGDLEKDVYQILSEDNTEVLYKAFSVNLIEY